MILGHEDVTYELTEGELEIAKKIAPFLKLKTKENPVLASEIINGVNKNLNLKTKLTDARLRKIINYYRCNTILPVISNKKGYYVSYDEEEITNMCKSLSQRISSIWSATSGLAKFLKTNK